MRSLEVGVSSYATSILVKAKVVLCSIIVLTTQDEPDGNVPMSLHQLIKKRKLLPSVGF